MANKTLDQKLDEIIALLRGSTTQDLKDLSSTLGRAINLNSSEQVVKDNGNNTFDYYKLFRFFVYSDTGKIDPQFLSEHMELLLGSYYWRR